MLISTENQYILSTFDIDISNEINMSTESRQLKR